MSSLTSVLTQVQQEYRPTFWSVLLHQIPHVNITFTRIHDNSFRPDSEEYLESLGIIGSVPAAWLIFTLIALLIYLLTRCCDTKNNKKRKSRPMRCCLSFFSLICCAGLGAGFWGNHIFHEESEKISYFTDQISTLVEHAQNQAKKFDDVLSRDVRGNLSKLYDGTFQTRIYQDKEAHDELLEYSDFILFNITDGLKAMDKVRLRLINQRQHPVTITHMYKRWNMIETVRWPATVTYLGICTAFCLLLFIGAIVHSRGALILFSVCGLFSIIIFWLISSVYVTVAVALADFCTDPTPWIEKSLQQSYNISLDISDYFLKCSPVRTSPFQQGLDESQSAVLAIDEYVKKVSSISRRWYSDTQLNPQLNDLINSSQKTVEIMGELHNSLKCDALYRLYNGALLSACDQGLQGLIVMLLSAAVCAIMFTLLVWCNSHTWIYFKHKGKYVKVDDQDPYMPLSTIDRGRVSTNSIGGNQVYQRSRTIHTPPQTPPYQGTLNGHDSHPFPGKVESLDIKGTMPTSIHAGVGYGHIGSMNKVPGMNPSQGFVNPGHGTLGRFNKPNIQQPAYSTYGASLGGPGTTMTLGRKGHYASLRVARTVDGDLPLLGPNQGQYATLSKGCKTLESSDFY